MTDARWTIAAFAILGAVATWAAAASAQPTTKECVVTKQSSPDSETVIVRSGTGHRATVSQRDPAGTVHIEQHGKDHASAVVQSGCSDKLRISQSGLSSSAEVTQTGTANDTELDQAGASNRSVVSQAGNGNRAIVRQSGGNGNSVSISQGPGK